MPTKASATPSQSVESVAFSHLVKPNMHVRDIGDLISDVVDKYGYFADRNYCGHGIGKMFHCNPTIPHYRRRAAFSRRF